MRGMIPPNSGRNLGELRPQMRRLHDVYKGLGDSVSSDEDSEFSDTATLNTIVRKIRAKRREARVRKGKMKMLVTSDSSSESDNDSDEFTLATHYKNGRVVQHTSKHRRSSKGKKKTCPAVGATSDDDVELDGHVPPAAGSGVPQDIETEYEISVRIINRNPSEFKIEVAEKFVLKC